VITEEEFEALEEERKAEATQVVQDWVLETAINIHEIPKGHDYN